MIRLGGALCDALSNLAQRLIYKKKISHHYTTASCKNLHVLR
jgi:hypothetical protein